MNKIYSTLLATFFVVSTNAQLTQANHAPANGENFSTYQCDSLGINPGATGAGAVWNFSTVTTHSNILVNYTCSTVSNSVYPQANVAVIGGLNNLAYYKTSASTLDYYGGNVTVGTGGTSVAATLIYTAPFVHAVYPMNLNTSTTSAVAGTINVTSPLTTSGTFSGTSNTVLDGSGTLTLPGGIITFTNVYRVKTSQNITFTTSISPTPGTLTELNYDYYSFGTKAPLFSIATSTAVTLLGTNVQTLVTVSKEALATPVTGLGELSNSASEVKVFPNPGSLVITIQTDNKQAQGVIIYEITGKQVEKLPLVDGKLKLDVSEYNKGLFIYSIVDAGNRVIRSGKLAVQ